MTRASAAQTDTGAVDGTAAAQAGDEASAYFRVSDVHAYYGESYIVQDVSFTVKRNEIVALLGRNGAGKTSTLRTLARTAAPELRRGEIWLEDRPIHTMHAFEAAREGIQLVPEDRRIIPSLTVEENLVLARVAEPVGWDLERIYGHFPRLAERRRQEAVTLSGGEQQMLAIARALARDIRLLLLDEPYEGLAPTIVRDIEKILEEVKGLGITTVIVEQNVVAALQLADRALILHMGEIVFDGAADEVLDNAELRQQYLAL